VNATTFLWFLAAICFGTAVLSMIIMAVTRLLDRWGMIYHE